MNTGDIALMVITNAFFDSVSIYFYQFYVRCMNAHENFLRPINFDFIQYTGNEYKSKIHNKTNKVKANRIF